MDDSGDIRVSPELQHLVGYDDEEHDSPENKCLKFSLVKSILANPQRSKRMAPSPTCFLTKHVAQHDVSAPLYVDVTMNQYQVPQGASDDDGEPISTERCTQRVSGICPIMLRVSFVS